MQHASRDSAGHWWWAIAIAAVIWWSVTQVDWGSTPTSDHDPISRLEVDPNAWNGYDLDCADVAAP